MDTQNFKIIIPENALQKLLCFQCHKYLSVNPIRVYPNRQVKCGRCSKDDDLDLGVESAIYKAVVRYMLFPCVNRYDGCNAVLTMSEMRYHESQCHGEIYDCIVCDEFKGIAYDLNLHCQTHHQKEMLRNSEFLIDFQKIHHDGLFFHANGIHLFFIYYEYNPNLEELTFDLIFIGKRYKGNMSYSLSLYSIDKQLIYKSKSIPCSIMESELGMRTIRNIGTLKFPRKLAVCQFLIHEEPELAYIENIPIIDSAFVPIGLTCILKHVYLPAIYEFKNIVWTVFIKRKLSLTDDKSKFGVFLKWDSDNNTIESCKVSGTCSLMSSDHEMKLAKNFTKEYTMMPQSHCLMLADWNYVMDPTSGFVKNNSITIDVQMKIHMEEVVQIHCKKKMRLL